MAMRSSLVLVYLFYYSFAYSIEYASKLENLQDIGYENDNNSQFHSPAKVRALQDSGAKQKTNQRVEQEQSMKLVGADIHTEIEMPVHIKILTITEDEANAIIANKNI